MTNLTTELSIEWNTRRRRWALRKLVSVSISSLSSSESIEGGRRVGQTLTLRRLSLVTGEKSSEKKFIIYYIVVLLGFTVGINIVITYSVKERLCLPISSFQQWFLLQRLLRSRSQEESREISMTLRNSRTFLWGDVLALWWRRPWT